MWSPIKRGPRVCVHNQPNNGCEFFLYYKMKIKISVHFKNIIWSLLYYFSEK